MITSNNTPNYQVIAESVKGILFKNKRDRKVINVDPHVHICLLLLKYFNLNLTENQFAIFSLHLVTILRASKYQLTTTCNLLFTIT